MSSKKGGRTYSNQAPNMRGGPKKGASKKGGGGKHSAPASGAPVAKGKAGRKRSSRAQNAFSFDEDGEERMDRYDADAADSREYRLPDNFEDEDLDSDEEGIFDDADEEKYGDVFAKGKQSQQKGKKSHASTEDDSEEREEDYDEDGDDDEEDLTGFEGAETMQLSDMLDMGDEAEEEEEKPAKKAGKAGKVKLTKQQQQMLMMDDEDDEDAEGMEAEYSEDDDAEEGEDDEDLDMDEEYDEDEEEGEDAHKNLLSFVQGLQAEKESASDKKAAARKGKKGAVERTEAFDEDQFALPRVSASKAALGPGGKAVLGGGLKLGDLLKKLPGAKASSSEDGDAIGDNANIAALKKKFNVLQSAHTQTLVEPLPEIRQEEMTRIASYGATKEDVAKWAPLINRHRDAASLSFPLYEPGRQNQSSAEMQTKFQPSADSNLEKDLEKLLNSYGMKESALAGSEAHELTQRHYTPEELQKREDSLAKMKALLFYQEMKQKRINKIKSKNYRRLKKKLREKGKLTLEEMKQLDPEAYEAEQRKADLKRIEERMSLNHSNSSKWMQKQLLLNKNQRGQNTDVREAMREANQKSSELRAKMDAFPKQKNSDGEEESSDSQEEEEEEEEDEDEDDMEDDEDGEKDDFGSNKSGDASAGSKRAAALRAKLRELEAELGASTEENEPAPGFDQAPGSKKKQTAAEKAAASSGEKLLNLKFMQKAMEKKREETRAMIREYEAELDKEEKKTAMKRDRRRQGLEPLDEEELDRLIDEEEANNDESKQLDAMLHGRKKIDAKSVAAKGTNISFTSGVGENNVKLLPNSLQSVSAGMNRGSKVKVDAPIAVAVPKQSAAAAAAALKTENKHPGQHHTINGKSSSSVDTHFISKDDSKKLFATEDFSSGSDEDEGENKAESVNKVPLDMAKLKHEGRAAAQAAKKKAAAALKAELAVSVAGQGKADKAKKSVQFSSAADEAEDEDLDAAADAQDAQEAEEADESNPWSAANVANPRKALRDTEANSRRKKKQKLTKQSSATDAAANGQNDDEDEEADEDEAEVAADIDTEMSLHSRRSQFDLLNSNSLSQAELVRKAFSNAEDDAMDGAGGDDEDDDFARLKREMMEEDLPKDEKHDVVGLPGWGSWGGAGAQNFKSPAQIAKEAAEKRAKEAKRAAALSMRRDAHLKHVIINEKIDQKAMKYQVSSLPYPFTSQEQYEKSLATPVGKEWNTSSSFQQNIKPRVITKAGEIIAPIKFNPKVGVAGKKAAQGKGAEKEITKISGGNPTAGQKRKR